MSDFYNIKQVVLGCVSRLSSSFNTGTQNFVDIAVNNAIIYAQRKADFEWNKGDISIECDPTGNIMSAKDEDGCVVKIKKIIKAYGLTQPPMGASPSIPYLSKVSQIADDTLTQKSACWAPDSPRVIHNGQKVFHVPTPTETPYNLYFYAVKWLPRLVKDSDTNFLLEYGFDFIMYRSILELNFFIKEEERFQVSQAMVQEAWNTLVGWDASLISPTETEINL